MRLAYSIAIQIPFDVLLLDEVLAVGDEAFQEKCFATFERFKEEGKTVVFVSHALDLVERFCDRCLFLQGGVVRAVGAPHEVDRPVSRARSRGLSTPETPPAQAGDGSLIPKSAHEAMPFQRPFDGLHLQPGALEPLGHCLCIRMCDVERVDRAVGNSERHVCPRGSDAHPTATADPPSRASSSAWVCKPRRPHAYASARLGYSVGFRDRKFLDEDVIDRRRKQDPVEGAIAEREGTQLWPAQTRTRGRAGREADRHRPVDDRGRVRMKVVLGLRTRRRARAPAGPRTSRTPRHPGAAPTLRLEGGSISYAPDLACSCSHNSQRAWTRESGGGIGVRFQCTVVDGENMAAA